MTSAWLKQRGYSIQLIQKYVETGWLESIGVGAFKRKSEHLSIFGALWALAQDIPHPIRIGGRSALEYQGFGHNVSFSARSLLLFSMRGQTLPKWFTHTTWDYKFSSVQTDCFKTITQPEVVQSQIINGCSVVLSAPELAILEACYLSPKNQDLEELGHFMESLTSLRPNFLQKLLEGCTSIKTKRLFLFLARKYQHPWFAYLDEQKINLGKGKRLIMKGQLDKHYHITLPKEWFDEA